MSKPETPHRAWYLIFTKPRREKEAQEQLGRQGYQTYLPLLRTQRKRNGRFRPTIEPMFPRYLFIHLDDAWDNWSPIRSTLGVAKIVRFGETPARVPDDLIAFLSAREDAEGLQPVPSRHFGPGEVVKAVAGPMTGYEGIFERELPNERVVVLYDIVGKYTRVTLPRHAIEPVPATKR